MRIFKEFLHDTSGATAVEYGLIAALIALVCVASFTYLGNELQSLFGSDSDGLATSVQSATQKISG